MSVIEGWRNIIVRTMKAAGAQRNLRVRFPVFATRSACRAV
jgi:hypothetical protein